MHRTQANNPRSMDRYSTLLNTYGNTEWWGNHFWHHCWYIRNVLTDLPDTPRLTAYANNDATEYRVKYKGKWYKGFVTLTEDRDDTHFIAYTPRTALSDKYDLYKRLSFAMLGCTQRWIEASLLRDAPKAKRWEEAHKRLTNYRAKLR